MDTPIRIMADSGATVNILSKKGFDGQKEKPKLTKTNVKVYPYRFSKPVNLCGKLKVGVAIDKLLSEKTFYMAESSSRSILTWITSQKVEALQSCTVQLNNLLEP